MQLGRGRWHNRSCVEGRCGGFEVGEAWRTSCVPGADSCSASLSKLFLHTFSHFQEYFTRIMKKLKEVRGVNRAR